MLPGPRFTARGAPASWKICCGDRVVVDTRANHGTFFALRFHQQTRVSVRSTCPAVEIPPSVMGRKKSAALESHRCETGPRSATLRRAFLRPAKKPRTFRIFAIFGPAAVLSCRAVSSFSSSSRRPSEPLQREAAQ